MLDVADVKGGTAHLREPFQKTLKTLVLRRRLLHVVSARRSSFPPDEVRCIERRTWLLMLLGASSSPSPVSDRVRACGCRTRCLARLLCAQDGSEASSSSGRPLGLGPADRSIIAVVVAVPWTARPRCAGSTSRYPTFCRQLCPLQRPGSQSEWAESARRTLRRAIRLHWNTPYCKKARLPPPNHAAAIY